MIQHKIYSKIIYLFVHIHLYIIFFLYTFIYTFTLDYYTLCLGGILNNYSHSTRLLAATTLRNVLGTRNLAEILSERESISSTMQSSLDEATDPWGVKVERVEM